MLRGPIGRAAEPVPGTINDYKDACAHDEHRDEEDKDTASQRMKRPCFRRRRAGIAHRAALRVGQRRAGQQPGQSDQPAYLFNSKPKYLC